MHTSPGHEREHHELACMRRASTPMIIGIDFDNTIVCYDGVFFESALERNLISRDGPKSKTEIRDMFRSQDREDAWTELQGFVYGPGMKYAKPFPGVMEVLSLLAKAGNRIHIISHRTVHPYLGPEYDLHSAAREWISDHGLEVRTGIVDEDVFFEITLESKITRIRDAGCDVYVDDLPKCLEHELFPTHVRRILFDPDRVHEDVQNVEIISSWSSLRDVLQY